MVITFKIVGVGGWGNSLFDPGQGDTLEELDPRMQADVQKDSLCFNNAGSKFIDAKGNFSFGLGFRMLRKQYADYAAALKATDDFKNLLKQKIHIQVNEASGAMAYSSYYPNASLESFVARVQGIQVIYDLEFTTQDTTTVAPTT